MYIHKTHNTNNNSNTIIIIISSINMLLVRVSAPCPEAESLEGSRQLGARCPGKAWKRLLSESKAASGKGYYVSLCSPGCVTETSKKMTTHVRLNVKRMFPVCASLNVRLCVHCVVVYREGAPPACSMMVRIAVWSHR